MSNIIENNRDINELVKENFRFIISTISNLTGRYVSIENDEEFSIGILAFSEALEKYEPEKGDFHSFAKLVIESRIKNYLNKEKKHREVVSMEHLKDLGIDVCNIAENPIEDKGELVREIHKFKKEILLFKIKLEDLVNNSPKHKDTRKFSINLSEKLSKDGEVTEFMYEKKRLPVKKISLKYVVTERILKRNKIFIISVIIIFFKKYRNMMLWIKDKGE